MNDATATLPDKRQVAASFSRAAHTYDSVAGLQRDVGENLLALLSGASAPARWLDLGSGTGYFSRKLAQRWPDADGLAVDIAEGMLTHARTQGGARWYSAGDAESLPLRDGCVDLVFTSLAVQWCEDFTKVLAEAHRVLRPGGRFAFASLCTGTLGELRASWEAADGQVHVNRFRPFEAYQQLCDHSGLRVETLVCNAHVLHYPDVRGLTHELKALGAHNLNPGRPGGLTGRARIAAMVAAYESFRQTAGLPATYQVVYGVLSKP
ncbi:malonyl-ACP O-methyltransferase BioC [Pseudomonas japonica]|uniref:malonyl-ACP O-methyltransferase BioC n=1 Tax=Pseudomonas japonica TaxID=256466 RepID=UPI0015E35416|nr:malonyl-ACP O-methyltransferase BioC [Pseudomonas japonica]MBA1287549.1 malonyl-ACP O-methyltransferase BioC [Pseudomonas japonica]